MTVEQLIGALRALGRRIIGLVHHVLAADYGEHGWLGQHTALAHWIAGLGQAVGAGGTLWAVITALGAERKAEARRVKDAEELEKARVRLVSVRLLTTLIDGVESVTEGRIRNDGPGPVFHAGVIAIHVAGRSMAEGNSVLVGYGGEVNHGKPFVRVIESRKEEAFFVRYVDVAGRDVIWPLGRKEAVIEFKDSNGKAWRRVNDGEPVPIERVTWEPGGSR
jgi:hypothetical protein